MNKLTSRTPVDMWYDKDNKAFFQTVSHCYADGTCWQITRRYGADGRAAVSATSSSHNRSQIHYFENTNTLIPF